MSKAQKKDDVAVGGLRIVYQDTSKELEELILTSATNALKALYKGEKNHFTEVAQQIKHEIEETQEGAWHVIVGKSFGSFVSHEVKKLDSSIMLEIVICSLTFLCLVMCRMLYFFLGQIGFLVYRHG